MIRDPVLVHTPVNTEQGQRAIPVAKVPKRSVKGKGKSFYLHVIEAIKSPLFPISNRTRSRSASPTARRPHEKRSVSHPRSDSRGESKSPRRSVSRHRSRSTSVAAENGTEK